MPKSEFNYGITGLTTRADLSRADSGPTRIVEKWGFSSPLRERPLENTIKTSR